MIRISHHAPALRRYAAWPLAIALGLAGCASEKTPTPRSDAPTATVNVDPVLEALAGVWEIDCGNNFVQFKLTVAKDSSGTFEWQTYKEPNSKETKIDRMDLRLEPVNGAAVATVVRADSADYTGKKMRLSTKDANSIVAHGDTGAVLDMDYTLYRESAGHEVDCGGD